MCRGDLPAKNGDDSGSVGIRYFISSKDMKAEEFGQLCRGHWGVESMHWWLDAVMNEDDSRITYKHAAQNLSRIRQMLDELNRLSIRK